jgi:hypothetical protein
VSSVAGRPYRRGAGGPRAGAAAWLLGVSWRLLTGGLGRRLGAVAVLTVVFVAAMSLLYDHAERPAAGALPAAGSAAVAPPAGGDLGGEHPAPPRTGPAPVRRRPPGPATVAAGWYATRLGVPAGKVRALAGQRLGPGRQRVLVLADLGRRQPTAWVTLRHANGGWAVTS